MSWAVGTLVTATKLAWTVYTACQAAPHEFTALSEEVEALHIVLEGINKVVCDAGLDDSRTNDLHRVSQGCITVLTELEAMIEKYKSLGTRRRKAWDKLKWGQENTDLLRGRLISNISLLSAFNSSLINATQTTVIMKLDEILAEGRTKGQPEKLGAMSQHVAYHKPAAISPRTDQVLDEATSQIEIVSATFGTLDVTSHMRQFFRTRSNLQAFRPSTPFFGGVDSIPNFLKAFILVWRMTRPSGDDAERWDSVVQTTRCLEGHPVTLNFNTPLLRFIPPEIIPHDLLILSASYHTWDVTAMVVRIVAAQSYYPLVVHVTNAQFGADPAVNTMKQLSVTYAYRLPDGSFDEHTQVNGEHGSIIILHPDHSFNRRIQSNDEIFDIIKPSALDNSFNHHSQVVGEGDIVTDTPQLQLTIHVAYWADLDMTQLFRSRVSADQTLHFNTHSNFPFDPWYNVSKTYSIMYQYTNGPLQLIVFHDSSGMISISPTSPPQQNFFDPARRQQDKINVLAVVWGTMQAKLDASQFRWISETGSVPCNNEWFKFDGQPGWHKTCHVFYELGTTGTIKCMAAREGTECYLPQMPLKSYCCAFRPLVPGSSQLDSHGHLASTDI